MLLLDLLRAGIEINGCKSNKQLCAYLKKKYYSYYISQFVKHFCIYNLSLSSFVISFYYKAFIFRFLLNLSNSAANIF